MINLVGGLRNIFRSLKQALKIPHESSKLQLEEVDCCYEENEELQPMQLEDINEEVMAEFVKKYGLENLVDKYTTDRSDYVYREREAYFNAIFQIFGKSMRRNIVLSGQYGSGRDALANGIAERIKKKDCPSFFWNWDMICLDMDVFLDARYSERLNERFMLLEKLIHDADKLIVYIKHVEAAFENQLEQELANVFSSNKRTYGVRVITTMETEFCSKNGEIFLQDREGDSFELVSVLPPEENQLYNILRHQIMKMSQLHNVEVEEREFRKICNEAIRINDREVQLDMILDILDAALSIAKLDGLNKLDFHSIYAVFAGRLHQLMSNSEADRRFLAEHEAAHAVVSVFTNRIPSSVTIIANDTNLGYTCFQNEPTITYDEDKFYERLAMLMAPYALNHRIKKSVRHDDTAGDRKAATAIALEMLLSYGMNVNSDSLGECIAYSEENIARMGVTDEFMGTVAKEVEAILQKSITIATKILNDNLDKHKLITDALLRNASLTSDEIRGLITGTLLLEDIPDPRLDDFT